MDGIETAQLSADRKLGRGLDQTLINLDHTKRGPLFAYFPSRRLASAKGDSTSCLYEASAADEPPLGTVHRIADNVAARLSDVALDQRARVEIEVQRSASRSASTSEDALLRARTSRGARAGRARAGGSNRP
jgi:hypothetical protein